MRIERLALKGLLRFADTVALDLRDLPPGVIAVTGENGAGKTTLLEAAMGCLHRTLPSRDGELVTYATGRDSFLELEFVVDGIGAYRARVNLDGPKRSTDAVLEQLQPDGRRVPLNDGKVSTYDAVIRQHFPSPELMLASSFSAQNKRGNFIGKKPKERKELFAQLLGMERYETMSQTAKGAAGLVEQAKGRLAAVREVLARETADAHVAELDRVATELQVTGGQAEARRRELGDTIEQLEARLAMVQDQVAAYMAASQRVASLDRELAGRRAERDALTRQRNALAVATNAEIKRIATKREADLAEIANKLHGNERIREQAPGIRKAAAAITGIDATLVEIRAAIDFAQQTADAVMKEDAAVATQLSELTTKNGELTRARRSASLLSHVPCGGAKPFAACQFLKDASSALATIQPLEVQVESIGEFEEQRTDCARRYSDLRAVISDAQQRIRTLEAERAALGNLAKYAEPLAAAEARIAELTTQREQMSRDADERLLAVQGRDADQAADLEDREGRILEIVDRLDRELTTARADLVASTDGNHQAIAIGLELKTARVAWDATTAAIARVESGRLELQRRRDELVQKRVRLADLDGRIDRLNTELLDWQLLMKALGRDGLPVLEIDAAGPTISAYTNELLTACFGPRFTVELVTQEAKADGKGLKDAFELKVFDNQRGGEPRDVSDLSGGEQVVVSEALMNAIAVYINTRAPMPIRTCWRDETTGALDPENAQRYIAMLRKVHELGGFHHTFFITHNPDAAAAADAQIRVAGGQAVIAYPPFMEAA